MRNFKITICYDGSEFFGWQLQPGKPTVQGALVDVASKLTQENVQMFGSGRTDAGVHALGQVAHFKTASESLDARGFQRAFNALLPASVRVVDAEEVGPKFNCRHDALAKTYQYRIYRGKILPPFERKYVMHDPYPLDVAAMAQAARFFEGTLDFTSLAASTGDEELDEKRVTTRTVFSSQFFARKTNLFSRDGFLTGVSSDVIEVSSAEDTAKDELVYVVRGKSFMRYMVRKMVGTLLDVGRGKLKAADIPEIIAAKDRSRSGATAPPQGLYLVLVEYGESWKF